MKIAIAFDNYSIDPNIIALWGFSAFIEDLDLLFDTGSDGRVLLKNMQTMGLDMGSVQRLFLSHPHWDHVGGVDTVIEQNPNITIYLTPSFSPRLVSNLKKMVREVVVVQGPMALFPGAWSTGPMGELQEHGLVIDTSEGAVLAVGCSHPGIVSMAKRAKEMRGELTYVIGGFHLFQKDATFIEEVAKDLKSLGVRYVTPTHCSGELAQKIFAEIFGEGYIPGGAGRIVELPDFSVI